MKIKLITAAETLSLRQRVLREGYPIAECRFQGDEATTTFHVGNFAGDELVCIASVMQQNESRFGLFNDQVSFQLRGMASEEAVRGQGFGTAVLDACVKECWARGGNVLWCNARIAATGFYQKQGFTLHPEKFNLPGVGWHQVMYLVAKKEYS
jgi:GNAT superfamily N-acetyltransferase